MTTRSKGPLAGFGWLKNGISVSYRHPKPLLGGAAFLLLACFLPSLITLPLQFHAMSAGTPPSPSTFVLIMAVSVLFALLLVPLYGGYLQTIDAAERGLPARALDVFKPYRQGEALPLIGYALAMVVVYIAVGGLIIVATGGGIASWYMQLLTAQANHLPPPAFPDGFGLAVALILLLGLFMMGFHAIGLGQVAMRRRNVFGAVGDGMIGAFKNLLPLVVFAVSTFLVWIAFALVILVVVALLTLLGKLVGAWLVIVLIIPLYIAMLLVIFAAMFGAMYHLWRDVCGDDIVPDMAEAIAA
jgi:hypothetical protein